MTATALPEYAEQQDIEVDYFPLQEVVSASFRDNCIVINPNMVKAKSDETVSLAHEVGHCVTGSFYNIYSPLDRRERHEHNADVWAIKKLLPFIEMEGAMRAGYVEVWELADYFGVTEDFIRKAEWYYTEVLGLSFRR